MSDDQICALPHNSDLWSLISDSCFTGESGAIPIVNTGRMFGNVWG